MTAPLIARVPLNVEQTNAILKALSRMPWEEVNDLIVYLQQQATAAFNEAREAAAAAETTDKSHD
jgi:hypothetical protein